jgi:hypothetical protein
MRFEPHDPKADEHNIVFGDEPMVFPGVGTYEVAIEVEAGGRETYVSQFVVEQAMLQRV